MTLPRDTDDPYAGLPTVSEGGIGREMVGLLLVLAGAAVLLWVLSTVDWRLPFAAAALAAIAGGFFLGRVRVPDDEGS